MIKCVFTIAKDMEQTKKIILSSVWWVSEFILSIYTWIGIGERLFKVTWDNKKLQYWKVQPSIGDNLIEVEPGSPILSYPVFFLSSTS